MKNEVVYCTHCDKELTKIYYSKSMTAFWEKLCPSCAHRLMCVLCKATFDNIVEWAKHMEKYHLRTLKHKR